MKKLILATIFGAFACGYATADRWYPIEASATGVSFVNLDSIDCVKGRCTVWHGQLFNDTNYRYDTSVFLSETSCHGDQFRNLISMLYSNTRPYENSYHVNPAWRTPHPNSAAGKIIKVACGTHNPNDKHVLTFNEPLEYTSNLVRAILKEASKQLQNDIKTNFERY